MRQFPEFIFKLGSNLTHIRKTLNKLLHDYTSIRIPDVSYIDLNKNIHVNISGSIKDMSY